MSIIILSGPVQSRKTTSIIKWSDSRSGVAGIVQPVIDNKRHLQDLSTGEVRLLETVESDTDKISVGKFLFSKKVLEWGKICLLHSIKINPDWIILDEVGKLELNDKGLEPAVGYIISEASGQNKYSLLIVVRNYLLDDFISRYGLKRSKLKIINDLHEI
ncbi:MAG: hypothetical protein JW995_10625 [Melioribacteraceae bacterium]|nr:hypothetical protein [Melioribacteraceae bacterium]